MRRAIVASSCARSPSPPDLPTEAERTRERWLCAASVAGAALVGLVGRRHGIDRAECAPPPALASELADAAVYLAGVALLSVGWLGLLRASPSSPLRLARLLPRAALVHLVALVGPPFLSRDPLSYAAIGRALARFGQPASLPLDRALPAGDPFLTALTPSLQTSASAYAYGFNELAALIARLGRDDLLLQLRLYQLLGLGCVLVAGALVGRVAGRRGAVLVLFCPLAVIEATQSGHNDALLMVSVALFVWLLAGERRRLATLALAAALLVKLSALLLLAMQVGQALLRAVAAASRRPRRSRLLSSLAVAALTTLALAVLLVAARRWPLQAEALRLVGSPHDPYDYCTRSIECVPRVLLRWVWQRPTAAWALGLAFRVLGALWLGHVALRAARARHAHGLGWLATGLFVYYLYLHGWSQSWYLLSLLPLLPFAHPRLLPAMIALCLGAVAYYAVAILFECVTSPTGMALRDLCGGAVTIGPPTLLLFAVAAVRHPARAQPNQQRRDQQRRGEAGDLAQVGDEPEQRSAWLRDKSSRVADDRRQRAERDGRARVAEDRVEAGARMAPMARPQVGRVIGADAERDRQRDEVHEVDLAGDGPAAMRRQHGRDRPVPQAEQPAQPEDADGQRQEHRQRAHRPEHDQEERSHADERDDRDARSVGADGLEHAGEDGRRAGRDPRLAERLDAQGARDADEVVAVVPAEARAVGVDADEAAARCRRLR